MPHNSRPEQDKNIGALFGTSLHKAIELRYKYGIDPLITFKTTMQTLLQEWEDQGYIIRGEEYFSRHLTEGRKILKEFDWKLYKPKELELNFTLPFPNAIDPLVNINGIIDFIDTKEYVIDWKSQRTLPTVAQIENDAQFILYYWAYSQIYNKTPKKVLWYNLRANAAIEIDIAAMYINKLQQLTEDIEAMISTTHFARINMNIKTCKTECSFYNLCFPALESGK